jgi:hypothetical protein
MKGLNFSADRFIGCVKTSCEQGGYSLDLTSEFHHCRRNAIGGDDSHQVPLLLRCSAAPYIADLIQRTLDFIVCPSEIFAYARNQL